MKKIKKLLVANRGEIAIRILRAASEMHIRTVAIYTYEDRYSLHRYKADEGYQIGEDNEPLKPYLNINEIIQLALEKGVDAIHPGYGFLSENVALAKACEQNNIIFVGPRHQVMEQLGDKVKAKILAKKAQVPLIEDSQQALTTIEIATSEANRIGYPVMMKAASGGGGRGMRVVKSEEQLNKAFIEARREAKNAFGDDTVFLEKYIENPKHIEVQLLGDNHGNLIHLYERDCSVQRRFQKVVEVAPAPNLPEDCKAKLYEYGLKIGKAVNYNNAGTVEFLVDAQHNIYFIEVNPRIQVEHTVTEEITGIDIVRSQILIAAGKRLDSSGLRLTQDNIQKNGFAIQCRITTEDPANDFKPDFGTLIAYRNAAGFGIRLDEGSSYPGMKISPFFDSLLVKVTASGRTLKGASQRLDRALIEYRIRGVKTNIEFLRNIISHEKFKKGNCTVGFIDNYPGLFAYRPKRDRATKVLRYLADVTINGNPNVKVKEDRVFETPIVPSYQKYKKPADGTKQILDKKGADGLANWLKDQSKIQITDTTFRDAHQSLLATRMRSKDMLAVAESYAQHHPNLFSMEVWGGATFDVAMRFLKECPWKRLRNIRKAIPNILTQMLLRGSNAVGYTAYPDNLVVAFIEKAAENGMDIFRIFDSLNWVENMKVSITTVRNNTNAIAEACICYTGDVSNPNENKYTLQYYIDMAKQLEDAGAHILAIKDMAGLLKPYAATELVSALKQNVALPIHLHTHDTSGAQLTTYLKAIEAGVDVVDVALSSLSGLTSQPNFNTLIEMLKGQTVCPDMDTTSLNNFADYWENVRQYYYPFESGLKSSTADVYQHEIPGGQYSNLKPQATALGVGHRMNEIKTTYEAVNKLFGNIVKVTPSSKVVGDLAIYMVLNNLTVKDVLNPDSNIDFPASTKTFFRGELGQPFGGFPKALQKIVLKEEIALTERANASLTPVDFDKEFQTFKQDFDTSLTIEDFISYKLYPKVFADYYQHKKVFGNVSVIPTPQFFYGLKVGEDVLVEIAPGKNIILKLIYVSATNDEGEKRVSFNLNGQNRTIIVKDIYADVKKEAHKKAEEEHEIGSPLQGMLSKLLVEKGDAVKHNQPLFIIEAMKMETTVTAPFEGIIDNIELTQSTIVEADDLVLLLKRI